VVSLTSMGGQQSKPPVTQDQVFEIPVQFSQDVIHHLSDSLGSTATSPERQSTLDGHIRSRIAAELKRLRAEEEDVRHQIQAALEKENLDRETSLAAPAVAGGLTEGSGSGLDGERKVTSSTILKGDLDEIQAKAEQYQARRTLEQLPGVQEKQKALIQCYRNNPKTTLECWREVTAFRKAIEEVEHQFVDSLR